MSHQRYGWTCHCCIVNRHVAKQVTAFLARSVVLEPESRSGITLYRVSDSERNPYAV